MADRLASLSVELSLQNEQFVKAIGQASQKLDEIGNAAKKSNANFDKMQAGVKNIGVALASAFAADKIISGIKNIVNGFDDLSKAAQKAGVAAEDLQRLQYAADLSGVSAEKLQLSMGKLSVALANIDDTSNESARALKAMGLAAGADVQQALGAIADRFASMPDGAQKTAEAIKFFGKAGADLIPLLNQGAAGIKEMTDEADRLGIVIETHVLRQAEQFNDNLTRMGKAADGVGKQITAGMMPAMVALSEEFVKLANQGGEWKEVGSKIGEEFVDLAIKAIELSRWMTSLTDVWITWNKTVLKPWKASEIWQDHNEKAAELDARVKALTRSLRENYEVASTTGPIQGPPISAKNPPTRPSVSTKGSDAAQKAAEAEEKAIANLKLEYDKLIQPMTHVQELSAKVALGLVSQKDKTYQLQLSIAKYKDEVIALKEARERYLATFNYEEQVRREAWEAVDKYNRGVAAEQLKQEEALLAVLEAQNALRGSLSDWVSSELDITDQDKRLTTYLKKMEQLSAATAELGLSTEQVSALQKKFLDELNTGVNTLEDSMRQLALSGIQGLTNAFFDAEKGFKNFAKSFLTQIAKMIAQQLLLKSLSGTKFGNFLGIPKLGSANGNAFGGATGLPWGVYDKPTFFDMPGNGPLTKFAKGGVLGETYSPEAILPLRRGANGRLGVESQAPVVNIYNNAPVQVRTEQEQDGSLAVYIEQIKNAIARDIRSGAGAVTSAMQGTYGLNRAAGAR